MSKKIIPFSEMTEDQRQLFIDYEYKELERHVDDIMQIKKDLKMAKEIYGIRPTKRFVDVWIEVGK